MRKEESLEANKQYISGDEFMIQKIAFLEEQLLNIENVLLDLVQYVHGAS